MVCSFQTTLTGTLTPNPERFCGQMLLLPTILSRRSKKQLFEYAPRVRDRKMALDRGAHRPRRSCVVRRMQEILRFHLQAQVS